MSDLLQKCGVCRALLDEEDLFCANCGTEAPRADDAPAALAAQTSTHNFVCHGCGASMSYDASARTLRCPFCGSEQLEAQQDTKVLAAQSVVPFAIDRSQAEVVLRQWLGQGFWRPGDLAQAAAIMGMSPVYVPYWVFNAKTLTNWTADTNQLPFGRRGDWRPLFGQRQGSYDGLLVGASGVLTPAETSSLCPFDLSLAVPPVQVDLDNAIFEQFRVQRKYARPQAHQSLEALEREACQQFVPGRARNLKVNVRLDGLVSEPMLLPVWIMAYSYQGHVFRFLINGQTGQAHGAAPISYKKILVAVAIVVAIGLLVFFALLAAGASR